MQLDSVRELKAELRQSLVVPMATSLAIRSGGQPALPTTRRAAVWPTIALGVTRSKRRSQFALAVRVQQPGLEDGPQLETIRQLAKGEAQVQYIGLATKRTSRPWQQKMIRPLKIGVSIGHHKISAGTLGGFVRSRDDGSVLMLSNNHVLANEGRAKKGDPILQPGALDSGGNPGHRVGTLSRFTRLKSKGANLADCAVAAIDPEIDFDAQTLTGLGKLSGLADVLFTEGDQVCKIGRTTGKTIGRVTAFELDDLVVEFGIGLIRFNNQVEIESSGAHPFSQDCDSGALIVDTDRRAVGLLFAGSDQGGSNGKGLTFANPVRSVLDALQVELVIA